VHVEEDDVRDALGDPGDRGRDIVGLAHDLDLVAEFGSDPGTKKAMIINDENPRE